MEASRKVVISHACVHPVSQGNTTFGVQRNSPQTPNVVNNCLIFVPRPLCRIKVRLSGLPAHNLATTAPIHLKSGPLELSKSLDV